MIKVDQFVDVKALHAQGHSIGQIVKLTGLARNTVRRIVRGEHPIETGAKAKSQDRSSKLDPFKDYIKNQVQQYDLSAVRILTDIRKRGYKGGSAYHPALHSGIQRGFTSASGGNRSV